jgi:hypothetical protein
MRWLEILAVLCFAGLALVFYLSPDWCTAAHHQDLAAFIAFMALVLNLVWVGPENPAARRPGVRMAIGALCGLTIAFVYTSGPTVFVLSTGIFSALGHFGLDWAA